MSREAQVRFCERRGVRFPPPTLLPLSLSYRQLPPTSEPASKQSKGMPRACRTWHDAIPDDPAPMMHTRPMGAVLAGADGGGGRLRSVTCGSAVRRRPPVPAAEERD